MRIGAALEALDFVTSSMIGLERRDRLNAYATTQCLTERLRTIARVQSMSFSLINAQLLKIQFSVEALAGLGGGRSTDEQQLEDVRKALDALAGPDCFGLQLDTIE